MESIPSNESNPKTVSNTELLQLENEATEIPDFDVIDVSGCMSSTDGNGMPS